MGNNEPMGPCLTTTDVNALQTLLSDLLDSDSENLRYGIVSSETLSLLNKYNEELKISLSS